ncbi:MAG: siderophore-interacting protein [Pseudomonadota bacterium]
MTIDTTPTARRVQRVRHETRRRDVVVARTRQLGANFASITFAGDALADFRSDSFDDHIKFFFEGPGGETVARDYTPRLHDPQSRELTIEFALHGDGPACDWARKAAPGARATIGGPRSSFVIPADWDWHLLVGDSAALPAIDRRLEELPAGSRVVVLAQAGDANDERQFRCAADLDARWFRTETELVSAVAAFQPPAGDGYTWCAGEAATMKRLRDVLLIDKQLPRECVRVAAYWKRGASSHHETLD